MPYQLQSLQETPVFTTPLRRTLSVPMSVPVARGMATWKIALLAVGGVVAAGGLGFGGWKLYKHFKKPAVAPAGMW